MKLRDVVKVLEEDGWRLDRQVAATGSIATPRRPGRSRSRGSWAKT